MKSPIWHKKSKGIHLYFSQEGHPDSFFNHLSSDDKSSTSFESTMSKPIICQLQGKKFHQYSQNFICYAEVLLKYLISHHLPKSLVKSTAPSRYLFCGKTFVVNIQLTFYTSVNWQSLYVLLWFSYR